MATKVVVPSLGESIVEATIVHWYKKEGETVSSGEKLVELETDKVNLDVGAERNGVIAKIEHAEGDDVRVGDVLALIDEAAEGKEQPAPVAEPEETAEKAPEGQPAHSSNPVRPKENVRTRPEAPEGSTNGDRERVTPVARRMAEEHGLNATELTQINPGGRVTKQDVAQYIEQRQSPQAVPAVAPVAPPPAQRPQPAPQPAQEPAALPEREERVILSRRRRTIAQRLVEAQHSAAMLTTFNEVDMSEVMRIRQERKEDFKEKYGVSLGIVSFFIKASILALKDFPQVNAELRGDELIIKRHYDIGVAIGAEEGLVVPVVRNADRLSFAEIEQTIQDYVKKTRESTLTVEDLRGGTFTITNGGVFGSLLSTPILNAPEVAILGLHRIDQRPVARDGQVIIRPMMYVALSYDHRVIDGREAVQFLVRIKEAVEHPDILLLHG